MSQIKEHLYKLCQDYLAGRIGILKNAIAEIQDAANNETKSTAGDKYETGREMMQQEINLKTAQLSELQKLKSVLDRIDPAAKSNTVIPGSLVYTNNGTYYISISAGKLLYNGNNYFAISAESPIGKLLAGKARGDRFDFNSKEYILEDLV